MLATEVYCAAIVLVGLLLVLLAVVGYLAYMTR
jgi:hypothetical protein